jgi:hypothetical protein
MGLLMRIDEPMQPKDIAEALEKNRSTTRVLLANMKQDGQVEDTGKGYVVAQHHKQAKQHKQAQQDKHHKQAVKSPAVDDAQGVYGVYGDGGGKELRLSGDEAEEVKRLIGQGMKPRLARDAVLQKRDSSGGAA